MMKTIKITFEYECHFIWEYDEWGHLIGNKAISEYPLSKELIKDIVELEDIYQRTYNRAEPQSSGFPSAEIEEAFYNRVKNKIILLKEELSGKYHIKLPSWL